MSRGPVLVPGDHGDDGGPGTTEILGSEDDAKVLGGDVGLRL